MQLQDILAFYVKKWLSSMFLAVKPLLEILKLPPRKYSLITIMLKGWQYKIGATPKEKI
jgi:hypothetical protein